MRFLSFGVCHSVAKLCARWASVRFRRTRSSSFRCFEIYNLSRMLSSYLPNRYISTANVHHHTRLEGPCRATDDRYAASKRLFPARHRRASRALCALRPASCAPRALHVPRDSVVYSGCSPPNGARLTRSTPRIPRTLPTLARKRGERKVAFSAILRHRAKPPPPRIGTLSDIRKFAIRNTPTRTSTAPDHRNFERGSPIRCVSVRIILCVHCKKLVAQTPRRPSFYSLCPCASRARKSFVSGHGTAFWHELDPLRCRVYPAEFADLGFFCRICFVATGEERNPCQNAVSWPEIDKIRARAQRTTKLEVFPSPTFLRILLPAPQQRGKPGARSRSINPG